MMKLRHQLLAAAVAIGLASCANSPKTEQAEPAAETASPVIELTDMSMLPDNNQLVVIDFNASWCKPCRMFAPLFDTVARQYDGKAYFVSVDIDKFPELAKQFGVSSIPHVASCIPTAASTP